GRCRSRRAFCTECFRANRVHGRPVSPQGRNRLMPSRETAAPYQAIARLITAIGRDDFGAAAFDLVSREIQADHIVVQFVEGHRIRGLFTEGKVLARIADAVNRRYLERYHMLDRSLSSFRDLGEGPPVVTRFDPKLNESPTYSAYFFERTG